MELPDCSRPLSIAEIEYGINLYLRAVFDSLSRMSQGLSTRIVPHSETTQRNTNSESAVDEKLDGDSKRVTFAASATAVHS